MIFKKLHDKAKEPVRSTAMSAGLDVFSSEDWLIFPGCVAMVPTGITFTLTYEDKYHPWFIDMRVRSSLAVKGIMLANGAGVIDADYEGNEIKVLLYNATDEAFAIEAGDKIAQMIIMPHQSNKAGGVTFKYENRNGGFGSTGNG